ncbi:MAG TPA: putative quinol monooxygenase [Polyangiaceae bacterium]|nr:putative quinol monooxygenase [Polyangiaceae bacterium]
MIALHAELRVRPPHWETVLTRLRELLALTENEPGNLIYAIHSAEGELVLYELYRDRAACDDHLASPVVVAALEGFAELLLEPPRVRVVELLNARMALPPGLHP